MAVAEQPLIDSSIAGVDQDRSGVYSTNSAEEVRGRCPVWSSPRRPARGAVNALLSVAVLVACILELAANPALW